MDARVQAVYTLSPLQQGIVFHALSEPGSDIYVEQVACTVYGAIDGSLRTAWQLIVERHSILRTAFVWKSQSKLMQVVFDRAEVPWWEEDWRDVAEPEQQTRLREWAREDRSRGFALHKPPLLRIALFRLADDRWSFLWTHHHAILDGWSAGLVLNEVITAYNALRAARNFAPLPARPFRDYIVWLQKQDKAAMESFWRDSLAGVEKPTLLSRQLPKPRIPGTGAAEIQRELAPELANALTSYLRANQLTLSTVLLGAWAVLLSRYTGDEEVIFGSPSSGRPSSLTGVEAMVGMFINTLPVRVRVAPPAKPAEWLQRLQVRQAEARRYEFAPLYDVQRWSGVPAGSPLFDTTVTIENYPTPSTSAGDLRIGNLQYWERTNYPISLVAVQTGPAIICRLLYDRSTVAAEPAADIFAAFENAIAGLIGKCQLGAISLVSDEERRRLLRLSNGPRMPLADSCVHHLIEQQAAIGPEATAVVYGPQQLSYGELDRRANQLAHYLRERDIGPETPVALLLERSPELVLAMLAVLKAGSPFLPLDPHSPPERTLYMIEDAQARIVLTLRNIGASLRGSDVVKLELDSEWAEVEKRPRQRPSVPMHAANAAYLIYTSGSTGRPKGVVVPHAAVTNHMDWMQHTYPIGPADSVLQKTPITFDASLWEFFLALRAGSRLIMAEPGIHRDPQAICAEMERHQVTILGLVPTFLETLVETGELRRARHLKRIFAGGEVLPRALVERVAAHTGACVTNLYGPTETAIDSAFSDCDSHFETGASIPIGQPIANTQLYVLDACMEPVPLGVAAELYIGGTGLARGYLNRPALTAERFVPDPFHPAGGQRLYRTGDVVRRREDGALEFISRNDQQLKIRGVRIEPGEIESALRREPDVTQAIVLARPSVDGQLQLVAYLVIQGNGPNPHHLRQRLLEILPDYLVPTRFVFLSSLPLNSSGKVDRRGLPDPEPLESPRTAYLPPRNQTEIRLAEIWAEVLGVPKVGLHDNVFELGAHSVLVVRALALVKKRMQLDWMKLLDLFEYPTIAGLAGLIEQHSASDERAGSEKAALTELSSAAR